MRKVELILLFTVTFVGLCHSQSNIQWVQRDSGAVVSYTGSPFPLPPTIIPPKSNLKSDHLGYIYSLGNTDVYKNPKDLILCKYSKNGDLIWRTTFDNKGKNDVASKFCIDKNRNLYVGIVSQYDFNSYERLILKLDSLGNIVWTKSLTSINFFPSHDFIELGNDVDNNIYLGIRAMYPPNRSMAAVLKLNENGDSIWYKEVSTNTALSYDATSMFIDQKGNSFIAGGIKTSPYPSFLTKIDSSGKNVWFDTIQIFPQSEIISICSDTINSISALLSINPGNMGKFGIVKYDINGNSIFRVVSDSTSDYMKKICYDSQGNILIGGYSYTQIAGGLKVFKYNSSGNLLWIFAHSLGGTSFSDAIVDDFGNYYLGAGVQADTNFQISLFVINSAGILGNSATYIGPVYTVNSSPNIGGFHMCGSVINIQNRIFMNGYTVGRPGHFDLVTMGFSQLTGASTIGVSVPNFFSLHQNYPNPFNPSTRIKFDIPKGSLVKLKVYDLLGREVVELVNEKLAPGVYEYEWNGVRLPSGVYFYKLEAENFVETKRMVLIK